MNMRKRSLRLAAAGVAWSGLAVVLLALIGCRTGRAPVAGTRASADSAKSDVQLWSETCIRCHAIRDPSTYSDAQWDTAMHQMRVRADLTEEEYTRILAFLKSSN